MHPLSKCEFKGEDNFYAKSECTNDFMHLNALAVLKNFQNQYIGWLAESSDAFWCQIMSKIMSKIMSMLFFTLVCAYGKAGSKNKSYGLQDFAQMSELLPCKGQHVNSAVRYFKCHLSFFFM